MPNISSPMGTANSGIPLVRADALGQAAGLAKSFTTISALTDAIAGGSAALWSPGEPVAITAETAHGVWRAWDAVGSHARTVMLRHGLRVVLSSDASVVLFATGQPVSGTGNNGDVSVDWNGNAYYTKTGGAWAMTGSLSPATSTRIADSVSRAITALDDGRALVPSGSVTYTIPAGLTPMPSFSVDCPAAGTVTIARSGSATINGAGTSLTRTRANNPVGFVVIAHAEADAYGVSGA